MNQERLHGICLQLGGRLKEQLGRLAGDSRKTAAGKRDTLAGKVLEQRGIAAQDSARQLEDFMRRNRNWWDLSGH
jgi:uncharacterized protein YjbJ (UPF0337 family)